MPRLRAAGSNHVWSWELCGRFLGPGCPITTRTPNRCSGEHKIPASLPEAAFCQPSGDLAGVASFVDWYNHQHRHSVLKFVTPHEHHSGQAVAICRHRSVVYEQARQPHLRRWSRSTR